MAAGAARVVVLPPKASPQRIRRGGSGKDPVAEPIDASHWELLLLANEVPAIQAEWTAHHADVPGLFVVLVAARYRRLSDMSVTWIPRTGRSLQTLLARTPDAGQLPAFIAETPDDLVVVVLLRQGRASLYRLALPAGHLVLAWSPR